MKKSILALATAAALAAPLAAPADTILYGTAKVSVDYNDIDLPASARISGITPSSSWQVVNDDSVFGVMGSEDLGGGLSAVYQFEFGVDMSNGGNFTDNTHHVKYAGLKGGFGTLTLGTVDTPYWKVIVPVDIFNSNWNLSPTYCLGCSFSGYGFTPPTGGPDAENAEEGLSRLWNSVLYTTPDFNGFSASLLLSMDGSRNDQAFPDDPNIRGGWSNGIDIWNINAKYSNGPFFAGITYVALNGSTVTDRGVPVVDLNLDQWMLGLGYNSGPFQVGFIYENGTYNEWGVFQPAFNQIYGSTSKPWNSYLAGSYTFGNNIIRASYGQMDTGLPGVDHLQNYAVGYQYNLSQRTRLWVEYFGRSTDNNDPFYGDNNIVSLGTRVEF